MNVTFFTLLLFTLAWKSMGQMGLRTAPLTASKDHSNLGSLFSKWTDPEETLKEKISSKSIENELAAIFRGVAYGVSSGSTLPTTASAPPSSTASTTSVKYDPQDSPFAPVAGVSNLPKGFDYSDSPRGLGTTPRPVQQHYLEPSVKTNDGFDLGASNENDHEKTDVEFAGVPWINTLGIAWTSHVYCSAVLFSCLAVFALYCLARIQLVVHLLPKGYYIAVHLLTFLSSFFRCAYFLYDPYSAENRLPDALSGILLHTGIPCMIASLALLILGLLKAAKIRILPPQLQSPVAAAIVCSAHIGASVLVDIISDVFRDRQWALAIKASLQALSAGWSAALCLGYLVIFHKIEKIAMRQQGEMVRLTFTRVHLEGASFSRHLSYSSLVRGARITLAAVLSGILLSALQVYGLMTEFSTVQEVALEPLVWFIYLSLCRLLEVILWTCICLASAQSASASQNKQSSAEDPQLLAVFACKDCTSCSNVSTYASTGEKQQSGNAYPAVTQSGNTVKTYAVQQGSKAYYHETIAPMYPSQKHNSSNKANCVRKFATLHSDNSDIHLLWNQTNLESESLVHSSRPSSAFMNDSSLNIKHTIAKSDNTHVTLCSIDGGFGNSDILLPNNCSLNEKALKGQKGDKEKYRCFETKKTPHFFSLEAKLASNPLRHVFQSQYNSDVYTTVASEDYPSNNNPSIGINEYNFQLPETMHVNWREFPTSCTNFSPANNIDAHLYDDLEDTSVYQSPLIITSPKSGHRGYIPMKKAKKKSKNNCICNNYNSSVVAISDHVPCEDHITTKSAPLSPDANAHVDYLTDASGELSPGNDTPTHHYSDSDLYASISRFHSRTERPLTSRVMQNSSFKEYKRKEEATESCFSAECSHMDVKFPHVSLEAQRIAPDVLNIGSTTPSQPRGILGKISKSHFPSKNDSYSPLFSDDHTDSLMSKKQVKVSKQSSRGKHDWALVKNRRSHCHNATEWPNSIMESSCSAPDDSGVNLCQFEKHNSTKSGHVRPLSYDSSLQNDLASTCSQQSSKSISSIGSHSDLPSECVDSDEESQGPVFSEETSNDRQFSSRDDAGL